MWTGGGFFVPSFVILSSTFLLRTNISIPVGSISCVCVYRCIFSLSPFCVPFFFSSTLDRSVLKALFTFTYYVLNTMHAMCCAYHKTSIGCNHGWAVQCVYGSNKFDLMHLRSLELNKRSSNFGVRKRIFFLSLFNFALDLSLDGVFPSLFRP